MLCFIYIKRTKNHEVRQKKKKSIMLYTHQNEIFNYITELWFLHCINKPNYYKKDIKTKNITKQLSKISRFVMLILILC